MNTYRLIDVERGDDGELIDVYQHDESGHVRRVRPEIPEESHA